MATQILRRCIGIKNLNDITNEKNLKVMETAAIRKAAQEAIKLVLTRNEKDENHARYIGYSI